MIKCILGGTVVGLMAVVMVLNIRAMNKMVKRNRGLKRVVEKQEGTIKNLRAIQNPYSYHEDGLIVLNDKDRIEKVGKSYFESMNRDKIKKQLKKFMNDEELLRLISEIMEDIDDPSERKILELEEEIRQLQATIDFKNQVIKNREKWIDSISKYLEKNNVVVKDIMGEEDEK